MNTSNKTLTQQRGVTMIEAFMTLAIAGILAGSALPSFKDSLDKRRSKACRQKWQSTCATPAAKPWPATPACA